MPKKKVSEIKLDARNYRKHPDRNKSLIEKSLRELGAGRSILIDSDNTAIAGNGVLEQAQKLGTKIRVIETDGSELIAVKRTDIKPGSAKRKKMALADNSIGTTSEFDDELLLEDFDAEELEEWGLEQPIYPDSFTLPEGDKAPFQQMTFTLADKQAEKIKRCLADVEVAGNMFGNENSHGNQLYKICSEWASQRK